MNYTSKGFMLPEGPEFFTKDHANANAELSDNLIVALETDMATKKQSERFVIGTSTVAGWTVKNCNYLCDGVADDVEINAAITALPFAGGEIVILDGTYNITAPIGFDNNVTIRGSGSTILKRMWNSTTNQGILNMGAASNGKVENITFDGNKANYPATYNIGINANTVTGDIITNNIVRNCVVGIKAQSAYESIITNNIVTDNGIGIYSKTASNNVITGNVCADNDTGMKIEATEYSTITGNNIIRGTGLTTDYTAEQYTIYMFVANKYNLISNNICLGKAVYVASAGTGDSLINNKWDASDDLQDVKAQINDLAALVGLGGIAESGSNANGSYIKFEDGTMICRAIVQMGTLDTLSTTINNIALPASFISDIGMFAVGSIYIGSSILDYYTTVSATTACTTTVWQVGIRKIGTATGSQKVYIQLFVMGRWKA